MYYYSSDRASTLVGYRDLRAAHRDRAGRIGHSGVEGVGMALQVLRDYYAEKEEAFVQTTHDKATGAASGIIGMLEVVESRGASFRVFVERKTVPSEELFCQSLDSMANAFGASISPDYQPTQYFRTNAEIYVRSCW